MFGFKKKLPKVKEKPQTVVFSEEMLPPAARDTGEWLQSLGHSRIPVGEMLLQEWEPGISPFEMLDRYYARDQLTLEEQRNFLYAMGCRGFEILDNGCVLYGRELALYRQRDMDVYTRVCNYDYAAECRKHWPKWKIEDWEQEQKSKGR